MCDIRVAFLRGLDTWPDFGRGWSRRVRSVRQVAARNALLDALLVDIAAGITSNRTLGGAVEWAAPGAPTIDDVEFEGAAPARAASIPVTLFYTVAGSPLA